jgi:RNA polymerase II C-terminal domain phosphatase-like 3/4
MSLAESPSPSPSSLSGSDDFMALLASELELASGANIAFPSDPSSAFPTTDDEGEDEDEHPEELEVESIEQNGYTPPSYCSLLLIHRYIDDSMGFVTLAARL